MFVPTQPPLTLTLTVHAPDNAELQPEAQQGGVKPATPNAAMAETLGDAMVHAMEQDGGDINDADADAGAAANDEMQNG